MGKKRTGKSGNTFKKQENQIIQDKTKTLFDNIFRKKGKSGNKKQNQVY